MPRICSVCECSHEVKHAGLCGRHYHLKRKYGEDFLTIPVRARKGEALEFIYGIPLHGDGCIIWPFATNGVGYGQVNTGGGKKLLAHRISCERLNGHPPTKTHHAAHLCGNGHKGCVSPWHLSWKTAKENAADKILHGTHARGDDCVYAKLSADAVAEIFLLSGSIPQSKIAKIYNVSQSSISNIVLGKTWGTVDKPEAIRTRVLPKSGICGIREMGGKWQARKQLNKKNYHLGTFETKEEAENAVLDWIHGKLAE